MKMLSDYTGDEAIELWGDLLDPLTKIVSDKDIMLAAKQGKSKISIARDLLQKHKKEAVEIMLRIDPTPIDGLNILTRLIAILADIGSNAEIKSFFGFAGQVGQDNGSSGYATGNTGVTGQ